MKIAILINEDTAQRCTGAGCLKAFIQREDAFKNYPGQTELVGFMHVGGDIDRKIDRMIANGVKSVHLSSCCRSKFADYEALAYKLSQHFDVIGYTHGNPQGKSRPTVNLTKR